MALSFSQSLSLSVSYCPFLHGKSPFSSQMQRMHTSKVSTDLIKFPSIRCSSGFKDKSSFTLQTCKNCKTQFDPALNHPQACRFHTAHFGECRSRRSSICRANAVGQNTENSYVEAYAVGRNIRMSADKARRVTEQLRGRSYEETLMVLELMPYRACEPILKLVFSAAANASHNLGVNKGSLVISKAFVNEGSTMKRVRPQARGRAHAIRKRTCHITIAVRGLASDSEKEPKPA